MNQKRIKRRNLFPYAIILPTVILLVVFSFYPMLSSVELSFTDYSRSKVTGYGNVGLSNYVKILTGDTVFRKSLITSVKWVISEVVLQLVLGMIFALLLNQNFRGRGLLRTISFAPWAVSGVLTTMLWVLIYNEHIGLLNNVLKIMNLGHLTRAWAQNVGSAFGSVVVAELWRGLPFFTITLLGGLQGIPLDLYEAAKVDGSNAWNSFWKITMPYMKESIVFATLMRGIWEFKSVDLIMTMTDGGPVRKTLTLPIYMYKQSITSGKYGYGAALTVILFLLMSVFVYIYLRANQFGKGVND